MAGNALKECIVFVKELEILLQYKRVKNITIYIKPPGKIVVSVPLLAAQSSVMAFLNSREQWMRKGLARFGVNDSNNEKLLVTPDEGFDGNTIWYWGQPLQSEFKVSPELKNQFSFEIVANKITFFSGRRIAPKRIVEAFYKNCLEETAVQYLHYWEARMHLYSSKLNFRTAKTRWGSCNVKTGAIMLNYRLMYRPKECLEYVVVHELAHLQFAAHDESFWKLVGKFMPDYKQRRELLNKFVFKI